MRPQPYQPVKHLELKAADPRTPQQFAGDVPSRARGAIKLHNALDFKANLLEQVAQLRG
jgi:hypothetical protein